MSIPDYQRLMLPVLKAAAAGNRTVPEAAKEIADHFGLTDLEREAMLPSGRQRVLHNRVHWAKFYLTKAGLLESPKRGLFTISDEGKKVLAAAPPKLDVKFLLAYAPFQQFYNAEKAPEDHLATAIDQATETPEEVIEAAHDAINAALRTDLLDRILQNSPTFFEQLIVDLLVAMGYGGSRRSASERLGKSGDGGVDGLSMKTYSAWTAFTFRRSGTAKT